MRVFGGGSIRGPGGAKTAYKSVQYLQRNPSYVIVDDRNDGQSASAAVSDSSARTNQIQPS